MTPSRYAAHIVNLYMLLPGSVCVAAEYLFPEAYIKIAYTSLSNVPPAKLRSALVPRCCSPPSRLAALKLLRELSLHSGANLQTSLQLIKQLHLPDEDPALHDSMPSHAIRY